MPSAHSGYSNCPYGWGNYVYPAWMVAEAMHAMKWDCLSSDETNLDTDDPDGWREVLAVRMCLILGKSRGAVVRRMYDILSGRQTMCSAQWASAAFDACGQEIINADMPILPGNRRHATDMAQVWAEDWTPAEQERLAQSLLNFSRGLLYADVMTETVEAMTVLDGFLRAFWPVTVPDEMVLAQNAVEFDEQLAQVAA